MAAVFLRRMSGVMLVLALGFFATACTSATPTTPSENTGSASQPAEQPAGPASGDLTVGTTEGPYYVSDTAELVDGNLNAANLPGDPIRIGGVVYGGTGTDTPLAGAMVEIWHADADGEYHPPSNGPASQYSADDLKLRGHVLTDAQGRYEFTSVYPGYYPGRTRHIHVRVSAEGYGAVVTQIIVPAKEGDGTTPETDGIAQSLPASYVVRFTDSGGVQEASFDFHLGAD